MQHLLLFARHPELGHVKTRLARTLGDAAALAVYEELLAHTRAAVAGLPVVHKTAWLTGELAPTAAPLEQQWPGYVCRPQPAGDLGQRLATAFEAAFAAGARAVVVIGTDCPTLTTDHLREFVGRALVGLPLFG